MPLNLPADEAPPPAPVLGYAELSPPPMIAVIWCRIFALWMLAYGLSLGAGMLGVVVLGLFKFGITFTRVSTFVETLPSIGTILIFLSVAWYCWSKAPALAKRMTADTGHDTPHGPAAADELLQVILIGVGVYLFTEGIPGVAHCLLYLASMNAYGSRSAPTLTEYHFSSFIRSALGVWLIVGPRRIAQFLKGHSGRWSDARAQGEK